MVVGIPVLLMGGANNMPRKPDLSLIGQTYNDLKVDMLTDKYNSYNRRLYECTCLLCGKKRLATKQNLQRGEIKNCGNHWSYNDIKDMQFGRLKAKYVTDKKSHTKSRCKIWHCECECGRECDILYNDLVSGNVQSCGCLQPDKVKELYVNGTAPCKLDGNRIRSTNTSGTTGVWYDKSRQKWCAEIMFKKKKYHLGRFDEKEDAITIRKIAEEEIFGDFLKWYENNK